MNSPGNSLVEFYVEKSPATLTDAKLLAVNRGFTSSVNILRMLLYCYCPGY